MSYNLSKGVLKKIVEGSPDEDLWQTPHILQLLSVRQVAGPREGQGVVRYRLIVSDGEYYTQAMLATQLNELVENHQLDKNAILRVDRVSCNDFNSKRLLIVLAVEVIGSCDKIGSPESLEAQGAQSTTASASVTPAAQKPAAPRAAPQPQIQNKPAGGKNILPIEALSPYNNNWTIRARVTNKSEIRPWSNARGDGKLFGVTFMDESGEIRGTAFNQQADEFYDKLQEGKVYYISKARVNIAKRKFSNSQNDYELGLERTTEIVECTDQGEMPSIKYSFVPIDKIEEVQDGAIIDVIAVVTNVGDVTQINTKTNRTLPKRELTLADQSGRSIQMTLWGKQAEQYRQDEDHPVIAFKSVKVGSFGGRSLSMVGSSMMTVSPDIPEAHALRGWYDGAGVNLKMESYSMSNMQPGNTTIRRDEMRTLADVKESQLGMSDKTDYFSCRATIVHIKTENISYPSCPNCRKKVIEGGEGWRCEKCDQAYSEPYYRYIFSLSVADYTGQAWLQAFDEAGEIIFGMKANEIMQIKERSDQEFTAIVAKANCNTFNFTCHAKQDTFNDQTRVRYGIRKILPLDYKAEASLLRDQLTSSWAQ